MDKKAIIEKSKEVFDSHPSEERLVCTTDGQVFLESSRSLAIDHARKSGAETLILERSEVMTSERGKPKAIQSKSKK